MDRTIDPISAFESGDYHAAALGTRECWQKYAALGMLGIVAPALAGLSRYTDDRSAFFHAATLFIAGRDRDALAILERLAAPEARALATLVAKDTIKVLAQLPYRRGGPQVLIEGLPGDPKFRVANHTPAPEDLPSPPDASVFDWYREDDLPDFYLCHMLEWHMPPADIHEAPFPVFAQTADTDIHIQLLRRWLPSFDAMFVTDTTEHAMVSRLLPGRTVAAAPSPFGWTELSGDPDPSSKNRPIDVFMSGIMLRPYFPDKVRLLVKLLREQDLNVFIIDGAVDRRRYLEVMAHSKATLCYTRNQQALVTRGIDALGVGCVPVIARDNVLKLSLPDDCDFEYSPDFSDVVPAVRGAIKAFDRSDPGPRAARARDAFAPGTITSRHLRALTVHAALTSAGPRQRVYEPMRDTRRNAQFINWPLPDDAYARGVFDHNARVFRNRLKRAWSSEAANNLAREYLVQCAEAARRGEPNGTGPRLRFALRLLDIAIAKEPRRLVLWLNYIRAARLLGDDRLKARASARLAELLTKDEADWTVSIHDDVMPPDYSDHLIDQYAYFAHLARIPVGRDTSDAEIEDQLKRIILASLHWLAGWSFADERRFAEAYRLNPGYGPIAFDFVISALRSRAPISDDVVRAIRHLLETSHNYAQLAAMVISHEERLTGFLTREEIERCRHLWRTYPGKVLPIEASNFSRGIGPFLSYGGVAPRPTRRLDKIGSMHVGVVVCEFDGDRPAQETDLQAIASHPYAGLTRAAGFIHPGLRLDPQPWRIVVGNTLAIDYLDLLLHAIRQTRGSVAAVLYDTGEFHRHFQARLLALDKLSRPIVMIGADPGSQETRIVGVIGSRSDLRVLQGARIPAGSKGWHDPYQLVRSLRDGGVSYDVWDRAGTRPGPLSIPGIEELLPKNRQYFAEVMARPFHRHSTGLPMRQTARQIFRTLAAATPFAADVIRIGAQAVKRWWRRPPPGALFDAAWYAGQVADIGLNRPLAFKHYMRHGAVEGLEPHPLFDSTYYLEQCADAGIRCGNPLTHFIRHGARLRLNPNPFFDVGWYLNRHPRVADAGENPLYHYLRVGANMGWDPSPEFDSRWYLSEHPEAAAEGGSPLEHYMAVGAAAGYPPRPGPTETRKSPI